MIVSFFSRGSGGGRGPVEYLLGKDFDRELAELLRGDALETIALIDSSPYAKKYTSGCLSFEEADLTPEKKRELMDSFEEALFPGMDKSQYNVLWVEHRDKGRLELNFVIPNLELETGRRLQPYFYKADQKRIDAWKTIQNIENGFSDPDDPAKRQGLTPAKDLPASSKAIADSLHAGIESMIACGQIENRADIVAAIEAAGLVVARQTKTFISIENPEGGRNIRLKGGTYEQDFSISSELPEERERRSLAHQQRLAERLETARERYSYGLGIKQAELAGSFKGQRKDYERSHRPQPESAVVGFPLASRVAHNSSVSVDRLRELARRKSAGARAVDSAGQKDAGELAERLAGGADRGQELLADGRGAAATEAAQDRQKDLVYRADGVEKDEQKREAGTGVGNAFQHGRRRSSKPMLGLQKGLRGHQQRVGNGGSEGQVKQRDERQSGERHQRESDVAGAPDSLRALQRADRKIHLPLRAFSAAGGRVSDGDRAGFLRYFKDAGSRLRQGLRSAAGGVAAARDRFLESCQRLGATGGQLERAQREAERASDRLERSSDQLEQSGHDLGVATQTLIAELKQEQRASQRSRPRGLGI